MDRLQFNTEIHNILNDFVDEIPMFQDSKFLIDEISKLNLKKG